MVERNKKQKTKKIAKRFDSTKDWWYGRRKKQNTLFDPLKMSGEKRQVRRNPKFGHGKANLLGNNSVIVNKIQGKCVRIVCTKVWGKCCPEAILLRFRNHLSDLIVKNGARSTTTF